MDTESTRYYSSRQEKYVAKTLGGSVVPNSGAIKYGAGDVQLDNCLIECKTSKTIKKSVSIPNEWLDKLEEEAFSVRKPYYALAFNYGPDQDNYYIINERLFKQFLAYISEQDS